MKISLPFAVAFAAAPFLAAAPAGAEQPRPNILWITSEDNGPQLGCYGDEYADTPNLDALAARGTVYLHCWSNAPVCAPARTTIISGMYPPSTGSEHMRSMTRLPEGFLMYPQYLREAGYYCTNNSKEDYNLQKPGKVWDDSSGKAHWKNRGEGQPFFAIFNITTTHESQIRKRPHEAVHDPARVRVPAYHPDRPEVRQDWAQYYDKLTEMDAEVGERLAELDEAGLTGDTIVFYYGDHGPGMPRGKRWPYNSGLHVPLIVHIPEKFRELASKDYEAGGKSERLTSFVDLAPTVLSLAGVKPPEHFQGRAFLGKHEAEPNKYLYGFRGRMDERYDMLRTVTDGRYVYIRNYMPHKIYGQHVSYMFQTPTTRVWKELYDAGQLNAAQRTFWEQKPAEELYDLTRDPDEVQNLAKSGDHAGKLQELRNAERDWVLSIRDVGFLPEGEIHSRSKGTTPYEMGHDEQKYPLEKILETAELATLRDGASAGKLKAALQDGDSGVRYWGALGLLMLGEDSISSGGPALRDALEDDSPYVRIAAAEALARYGDAKDLAAALPVLIDAANVKKHNAFTAMAALNVIDQLDDKAAGWLAEIKKLPASDSTVDGRYNSYVPRLLEKTIADLEGK